jgi:uncharacterized repeat protein (TIGR03803 family)
MECKQQFRNLILNVVSRAATAALAIAFVFALTVALAQPAHAQTPATGGGWTEKVLHSFDSTDGANPNAGLVFDNSGNLYGTTWDGGNSGYECNTCGTVFELTPSADGGWAETVLYKFCSLTDCTDGSYPSATLIFDAAGNLYGTTAFGGAYGWGTVFELTPKHGGGWTEKVLHSFTGPDGAYPGGGLIFDAAGNLYGTTSNGGIYACGLSECGTVFELTPTASGGWTEQVLHNFSNSPDGAGPGGALIFDAAGNLYGPTGGGGTYGVGTVFELTPTGRVGSWTEKVLYSFSNSPDGAGPGGALIFDAGGNLYGTTGSGGTYGKGSVFELTPTPEEGWTEKVLHSFGNGTDGVAPDAGVIFDTIGNLYGTTQMGGTCQYQGGAGCGTVFELMPTRGGDWTEMVLYNFCTQTNCLDGMNSYAGLIFDAAGNLYGTTMYGGANFADGTVFELTPVYPCAKCSHSGLREGDVLPAERRGVLEQGRDRTN